MKNFKDTIIHTEKKVVILFFKLINLEAELETLALAFFEKGMESYQNRMLHVSGLINKLNADLLHIA